MKSWFFEKIAWCRGLFLLLVRLLLYTACTYVRGPVEDRQQILISLDGGFFLFEKKRFKFTLSLGSLIKVSRDKSTLSRAVISFRVTLLIMQHNAILEVWFFPCLLSCLTLPHSKGKGNEAFKGRYYTPFTVSLYTTLSLTSAVIL